MIELDVDLLYLAQNYNIGTQRINQYGKTSLEDIMENEASNGNAAATNFDLAVLKDPKELAKVFKLYSARNRFKILKNMTTDDLKELMKYLDPKDLLNGLSFFTKDKLLQLTSELPKEKIALIVLNKFGQEKFLKMTSEKAMNKFFESDKLDKQQVTNAMQVLQPAALQAMMENFTGEECKDDKATILKNMQGLETKKFRKMLQCMNKDSKEKVIAQLTQKDPDLYKEFSTEALVAPLSQLEKPEIIKAMQVLEPEDLVGMLEELPKDLMSVVVTQIDPEVFADLLCNNFQDILADIAVA